MNYTNIKLIMIFGVLLMVIACQKNPGGNKEITDDNGLVINYESQVRLHGGKPFIEGFSQIHIVNNIKNEIEFQDSQSKSIHATFKINYHV